MKKDKVKKEKLNKVKEDDVAVQKLTPEESGNLQLSVAENFNRMDPFDRIYQSNKDF